MFRLNPDEFEAVSLSGRPVAGGRRNAEVVSQFPREGRPRDPQLTGDRADPAEIRRYIMTST